MFDGADAVVGADRFYKLDVRNGVLARKCTFCVRCCTTCVALIDDSADASLTYFAREAAMAHDYPVDAIVLVDAHGRPNGELLLVYQSESTTAVTHVSFLHRLCVVHIGGKWSTQSRWCMGMGARAVADW
jgi:hypothetical protein